MASSDSDFWEQFFLSLGMEEEEDETRVVEAMTQRQATPPLDTRHLKMAAEMPMYARREKLPLYPELPKEKHVEPMFEYLEPYPEPAEIEMLRGPRPGQPENLYSHRLRRR